MKRNTLLVCVMLFSASTLFAQYPQLTDEAKKLIDSLEIRWKEHSDSAWEAAFPIVVKEATSGKPKYRLSQVPKEVACTPSADEVARCSR